MRINGLKYQLSSPTDEYLIYLLKNLHEISGSERLTRGIILHRIRRRIQEDSEDRIFEILKDAIPRFYSLKIESTQKRKKRDFNNLCISYLFNLSYNLDTSLQPINPIDIFTRSIRIGRIRRSRLDDIDCPKRKYNGALVLYYQKGLSSESVDNQFISFYHVLEHFFEKVYNDELLISMRNEITKPGFSYKRNNDLKDLVKIIQKKLRYRNEEFQINEPEALYLTLQRFIGELTDEIRDELSHYDPLSIDYFKRNEVSFSKGNKVNFDEPNTDAIIRNLGERIYRTRNAIVHSKENDLSKYTPFKDDKQLSKEIILIRLIAEKIIIESSKEL